MYNRREAVINASRAWKIYRRFISIFQNVEKIPTKRYEDTT